MRSSPSFDFVFDTSALLCYLAGEPAANQIIRYQSRSAIPFIAYSELYYLVWQRKGKPEADRIYAITRAWNRPTLMPEERVILSAGRLKAMYHLGIADSYIAAFSLIHKCALITLDADFLPLRKEIDLIKLS